MGASIAHPLSWGVLGLYFRERGYSKASALLLSQVHSLAWEYVVEGSYMKPSGKDLVTNAVSATVAIYAFHPLSERAARRPHRRPHDRVLLWMNPLRPMRRWLSPGGTSSVRVGPGPAGEPAALTLTVSW